ncbi:hypothetical protein NDU88_003231 [Pleurodeles waltl]|uniref:Uncharacterized protein n=1 Tax=Pleurodeles waltl TaxID=8319 RepID=A0AAV7P913_PLEWA|nr:hypothetical protein NDU88_003231 [Pleurodeles waltl]
MDRIAFRFCPQCHAKYPFTDQHLVCNLCLSLEHSEDTCEACKSFRSKKTLRDRRARRMQMASKSSENLDVEEQEMAISIQGSDSDDSDGDRPPTAGQHVSTPALTQVHSQPKKHKASGTPLPEGHGSTHKKQSGDQATPSAPKKAQIVAKSSDSSQEPVIEKTRHRLVESMKPRKSLSEPRPSISMGISVPKKRLRSRKKPCTPRNMGSLSS